MHPQQQQRPPYAQPPQRKKSNAKWWLLAAAAVIVLLLVCVVVLAQVAAKVAKSLPNTSASPSTSTSAVRTPSEAQERAYLAALEKIDPGLVVSTERAIRRAERVCDRILHGSNGSTMTLEQYTVEELSGGNATIDEVQAKQVIKAVKVWCKP